jgi:hypothetical protein
MTKTYKLDEANEKPGRQEPDRSGPPTPLLDGIDLADDDEVAWLEETERSGRRDFQRAAEQMLEFGAGDAPAADDDGEDQ